MPIPCKIKLCINLNKGSKGAYKDFIFISAFCAWKNMQREAIF
ncbi:hypothetical protein HMPREF0322_03167 [Desulfitobacterium hafniense DP7]|uniref:Uncharacterized protein n=1 Tax=Desulfitobacterium hafniense DP7 TaxID=537010 RepID=G9XQC1_DESHA|nr:hypothetical protein HMPREF0322_03167 [Desulfitobacterium hafniense DP7]